MTLPEFPTPPLHHLPRGVCSSKTRGGSAPPQIVAIRALSVIHKTIMSQRKNHAFFSQPEQEQPICDCNCREDMTGCVVSSSVPEDASIDSAENSMAIKK